MTHRRPIVRGWVIFWAICTGGAFVHSPRSIAQEMAAVSTVPQPVTWLTVRINIPARQLEVIEHGKVTAQYPIAIGQPGYKSIVMSDLITRIEWNPWWYPPDRPWAAGAIVTPPGPGNPLGPMKLPLGQGIRIHGTNAERSIGRAASHGCFRMHNKDAVALAWYLQSQVSDKTDPALLETYTKKRRTTFVVDFRQPVPIDIVYEPVVVRNDILYLYPDVYGKVRDWNALVVSALQAQQIDTTQLPDERVRELKKRLRQGKMEITVQDLFRPPDATPMMSQAEVERTERKPRAHATAPAPDPAPRHLGRPGQGHQRSFH